MKMPSKCHLHAIALPRLCGEISLPLVLIRPWVGAAVPDANFIEQIWANPRRLLGCVRWRGEAGDRPGPDRASEKYPKNI